MASPIPIDGVVKSVGAMASTVQNMDSRQNSPTTNKYTKIFTGVLKELNDVMGMPDKKIDTKAATLNTLNSNTLFKAKVSSTPENQAPNKSREQDAPQSNRPGM